MFAGFKVGYILTAQRRPILPDTSGLRKFTAIVQRSGVISGHAVSRARVVQRKLPELYICRRLARWWGAVVL